jgi:hypothetical protein
MLAHEHVAAAPPQGVGGRRLGRRAHRRVEGRDAASPIDELELACDGCGLVRWHRGPPAAVPRIIAGRPSDRRRLPNLHKAEPRSSLLLL